MTHLSAQDRAAGLTVAQTPGGRDVARYSPELMLRICEAIAEGRPLSGAKGICKDPGMPTFQTVHRWVVMHPEAGRAYNSARQLSAHFIEETALSMAYELKRGEVNKDQLRAYDIAMQQLRWSAAKRDPRVYSDKLMPQIAMGVQINTSIDLGQGADAGVYTLEAKVVEPATEDEGRPKYEPDNSGAAPPLFKRRGDQRARFEATNTMELPDASEPDQDTVGGRGGAAVDDLGAKSRVRRRVRIKPENRRRRRALVPAEGGGGHVA